MLEFTNLDGEPVAIDPLEINALLKAVTKSPGQTPALVGTAISLKGGMGFTVKEPYAEVLAAVQKARVANFIDGVSLETLNPE